MDLMERTWESRRILKAVSRYTTSLCVDWLPARFAPYRSVSEAMSKALELAYTRLVGEGSGSGNPVTILN